MSKPSQLEINEILAHLAKAARWIDQLEKCGSKSQSVFMLLNAGAEADKAAQLIAGHANAQENLTGFCDACGQYNFQH